MNSHIYISGPITGHQDLNKPAFDTAEQQLTQLGYDVINPHNVLEYHPEHTWEDYMRADIAALTTCMAIALLPGWRDSRGAQLEVHIARKLGLIIRPITAWTAA